MNIEHERMVLYGDSHAPINNGPKVDAADSPYKVTASFARSLRMCENSVVVRYYWVGNRVLLHLTTVCYSVPTSFIGADSLTNSFF